MYTVEFYGNKGWEIGKETDDLEDAIEYYKNILLDKYDARLTSNNYKRW